MRGIIKPEKEQSQLQKYIEQLKIRHASDATSVQNH